jgi:hypothetical protein
VFGHDQQSFGHDQQSFGQDQQSFGHDQQSFGHDQQSELNCKAFLCDQYMCTQDECLWNLQNLTSGSLNPWIIPCDEMNQL